MRRISCIACLILLLGVGACSAQKPGLAKGKQIPTSVPYLDIGKHYDAMSETWYFLTRIAHTDKAGNLIKLQHAESNRAVGEAVRSFAIRKQTDLAINASMGYLTGKNQQGADTRKAVGIQIVDGKILQDRNTRVYTLGIQDDNRLVVYPPGTRAQNILDDGIQNALTAFIPLILNGQAVEDTLLDLVGNMAKKHPRQVIGQYANLDLLILSCGGRGFDGKGMTAKEVIRILETTGVQFAFMLDGGGSVSTVVGDQLITQKIDAHGTKERLRPNFLYLKHISND